METSIFVNAGKTTLPYIFQNIVVFYHNMYNNINVNIKDFKYYILYSTIIHNTIVLYEYETIHNNHYIIIW